MREGLASPNTAIGEFTMSKKTSKSAPAAAAKTSKASAKKPAKANKALKARAEAPAAPQEIAATPQLPVVEPTANPVATDATVANDAATAAQETTTPAATPATTPVPEASPERPARKPKAPKGESGKMSGLDAAALVLKEKGEPMTCGAMIETMLAKGLWSTNGKTPASTLYSAILREIDTKPGASRFVKTGRGTFGLTGTKA
jgi:hypothetical protein